MPSWLLPASSSSSAKPKLEILLDHNDTDLFFLYPSACPASTSSSPLPSAADTVIEGVVILTLPAPRRVKGVEVVLTGTQVVEHKEREHTTELYRRDLKVDIPESALPAGRHQFRFSFIVPPNVAPTLWHSTARTRHRLLAVAQGCGALGSDLRLLRKIALQVNNSGEKNGPPPSYSLVKEFVHDRFGLTRIEIATKHLLVGGYLRWYIQWEDFLKPSTVENITVDLIQTVMIKPSLTSAKAPTKIVEERRLYDMLLAADASDEEEDFCSRVRQPMCPGQEEVWISRQFRIPYDAGPWIGATTHPDTTQTCITFAHEIRLSVTFLQFDQSEPGPIAFGPSTARHTRQLLQVGGPVKIASCFCRVEYSKLPPYSAKADARSRSSTDLAGAKAVKADLLSRSRSSSLTRSPEEGSFTAPCLCQDLLEDEVNEYGVPAAEVYKAWEEYKAARDVFGQKREREMERERRYAAAAEALVAASRRRSRPQNYALQMM